METAAELIDALGGVTYVSERLRLPVSTVGTWRTRNAVPVKRWLGLIELAREKRVAGVTYESLTLMHAKTA